MKLTLRGMLAYLDEHCDWSAAEKADFRRRVEENKYAAELIERIRLAARRSRLSAPKVSGRGLGLDANTVAEYLEGALPPERISDFEKLCLESDMHLAEVAASHEILSDVVAGVRPAVRFGLKEQICALALPGGEERFRKTRAAAESQAASSRGGDAAGRRSRDTVPAAPVAGADMAPGAEPPVVVGAAGAAGALPWRGMAIALSVGFVLVIGSLRLLGPFDANHPLALWGGPRQVAQVDENAAEDKPDSIDSREPAGDGASDLAAATGDGDSGAGTDAAMDERDASKRGGADVRRAPDEDSTIGPEPAGDEVAEKGETADERLTKRAATEASADNPAAPPGRAVAAVVPAPSAAPAPTRLAKSGTLDKGKSVVAAEPEVKEDAGQEVARLVSEEQILAQVDPRDGLWHRLVRGTPLVTTREYVAPPLFRPQILVANSTQVMVVGPAAFSLLPPPEGAMAGGFTIRRGRAVLVSAGMPGTRVPLEVAGLAGSVVFGDTNSELAVEVRRYLAPGADPLAAAARVTRLFFVRRGFVEWQAASGGLPVRIGPDQLLEVSDDEEPTVAASGFPTWSEVRNVSKLDRDAYEQLEMLLSPDRPLTLTLEELQSFRKTEIRSLAARSLGAMHEYESLWRELGSDQQHSYWDRAVDDLREALAQGPDEAERVLQALKHIRGEDATVLFRLLRDYSPEQLARDGGAGELVGYLEHKSLDVRVLAFETLRRITGVTLFYRPESPAERRRVPMQKWRERLKEGQVVYKTLPGPPAVAERKPAPAAKADGEKP